MEFPGKGQGVPPISVLEDITLEVRDGEFVCLVGPSGCGKSTLLNIAAGFLPATAGEVRIDGVRVAEPNPRHIFIFQENAVFPWLTVEANIGFGLQGKAAAEVRRIVAQEVSAFLSARRQASVTPTVVALRSMATNVVDAEMERLAGRLPDLDDAIRDEILQTVRRVADKLLHEPTVRVKELANETGAVSYAAALAELFALDPDAVEAVTRPEGLS